MKRFSIFLIILLLLFSSCEDIFHSTRDELQNINSPDTDPVEPDPLKIIIGGNFLYLQNSITHEAIAALDGEGNYLSDFFDSGVYGLYGDFGGYSGIRSLFLTPDSLYAAGNFGGYDSSQSGSNDSKYQMLVRYSYDGSTSAQLDPVYFPANSGLFPVVYNINSIVLISDNKLAVGGDFSGGFNTAFTVLDQTGTENLPLPLISSGGSMTSVNKLLYIPDESALILSGNFDTINGNTGYENFAVIDIESGGVVAPGQFLNNPVDDPLNISDIYDIEITADFDLFMAGYDINSYPSGVIRKYFNDETNPAVPPFTPDSAFNRTFTDEISRNPDSSFYMAHVIAVDDEGLVYMGGDFYDLEDLNGYKHSGILRITESGLIDPTFQTELNGQVYVIEIQKNGKILIGGNFTEVNGHQTNGLIRLMSDGSIDDSFNTMGIPDMNDNAWIYAIAIEEEPEP